MDIFEIKEKFTQLQLECKCPECNCELFDYSEKSYYTIDFEDNKVYNNSVEEIIQCQNCKVIIYQE